MRGCGFIIVLFVLTQAACGVELHPWIPRVLEIETYASSQLQAYQSIKSSNRSRRKPACNLFFAIGAASAYEDFAAEAEAIASDSQYCDFGMDSIQITGRYRWFNDIVADPVSLVSGLTVSQVFKPGLRNLSSFHHGGIECEALLAIGRESSCGQFWVSRWWGLAGVGLADMGYPWIRANINWERNFGDAHQIRLFANTLWGLGPHRLKLYAPFRGYGSIRHQSVDVGVDYRCHYQWGGGTSLEYAYRVFARNCPTGVNTLLVSFWYPFGL